MIDTLRSEISKCVICKEFLPFDPRPIFQIGRQAKIVIIGQAPGLKVQENGTPWKDASGNELRKWLDVDNETFYNPEKIALVPMGFCYPGKGKSGDLPPRKECAPQWHESILEEIKEPALILLIGKYAQDYYLKAKAKQSLTETVQALEEYLPLYIPLPHPSPRNRFWLSKNPWFKESVIPRLQLEVAKVLR